LTKALTPVLLVLSMVLLSADTPAGQKKKSPPKSAPKKTASSKAAAGKKKTGSKRQAAPTPSWRSTQRTPTPERYKEIQQALAAKGYLASESPSGVWDSASVDALKRFQQDQNLEPSGKIDSLSLIGLGLGPRRDSPAAPAQQDHP
jgi:peptidoglycan hydrolase-like protein with peptidoglycan-binding domain